MAVRGLRARARAERFMPTRKHSRTTDDAKNKTYPGYPENYRPSDLGVIACPFPAASVERPYQPKVLSAHAPSAVQNSEDIGSGT